MTHAEIAKEIRHWSKRLWNMHRLLALEMVEFARCIEAEPSPTLTKEGMGRPAYRCEGCGAYLGEQEVEHSHAVLRNDEPQPCGPVRLHSYTPASPTLAEKEVDEIIKLAKERAFLRERMNTLATWLMKTMPLLTSCGDPVGDVMRYAELGHFSKGPTLAELVTPEQAETLLEEGTFCLALREAGICFFGNHGTCGCDDPPPSVRLCAAFRQRAQEGK